MRADRRDGQNRPALRASGLLARRVVRGPQESVALRAAKFDGHNRLAYAIGPRIATIPRRGTGRPPGATRRSSPPYRAPTFRVHRTFIKADGSDGPLASFAQAQQAVRQLKAAQADRDRAIIVSIRGGTYWLETPISFAAEDSGTERAPVVYQAFGDERPVFSGGRSITGWKTDELGRWYADLPDVKDGQWHFCQLFVGDQRRFRPQLPKKGYYKIAKAGDSTPEAGGKGFNRFGFSEGELDPHWANLNDVEVMPFHSWTASRFRVASIDPQAKTVTVSGHTTGTSWWASFHQGHRYLAVNVREALTEPGEWYLDRPTGRLTYLPKPGEDPQQTVVIAPRLRYLVLLAGDLAQRRWVQHVQLRGLTFAHSNWTTPPEGQAFPQAEINLDAAISAVGARQVGKTTLAHALVAHAGGPTSYFDLENPEDMARLADPMMALKEQKGLVVIDEIQRAPQLLLAIKKNIDEDRRPLGIVTELLPTS